MPDLSFLKFWDKAELESITKTPIFKQLHDAATQFLLDNKVPKNKIATFIVSGNEYLLDTDLKNAKLLLQLLNQKRNI